MASAVFRACKLAIVVLLFAAPVSAQPEVDARRIYLGTSGATCTLHTGSGAPSGSLGSVCDLYKQQDSPYIIYVKTGASTWTAVVQMPSSSTAGDLITATSSIVAGRLASVASGQVLASAGVGNPPAYTATPSLTSIGGAANLTLNPTGDLVTSPTGLDVLPGTGYTYNLGSLTNKYLTLHAAELWVETLVAQNTLATIGGRVLVGPTTTLTSDLSSGATSISVKHNEIANGDHLVMEANGNYERMQATSGPSGTGPYTYSVTRNLDGSGANNWYAGDAVFNTGTTGDGYIDLYSVAGLIPGSTAGPTIVGNVRTGTSSADVAPRWAIGNLNGLYGYGATTYGAAFGNPSATHITIDSTNGIRIRNNTTTVLSADTSGNLSLAGDLSVGTTATFRSGSTTYASGTGYVFDYSGSLYRMRIGTTSGNRIQWDGTNLTLVSANTTIDSNGVSIAPTTTDSSARSYGFTVSTGLLGMFGSDVTGVSNEGRRLKLRSVWTGTGNYTNGVSTQFSAEHTPSSGGTSNTATMGVYASSTATVAWTNASLIQFTAPNGALETDAVFRTISSGIGFGFQDFIIFTSGGDAPSAAGSIGRHSTNGLMLRGVTGSTYDFFLANNSGAGVIANVAGTTEIQIAGVSSDGSGSVLCVKSDGTIGTCTNGVDGSGNCTCS